VFVDITVRVASLERRSFSLEILDGNTSRASEVFYGPSKGFQEYEDITWRMVGMDPYEPIHSLVVGFLEGDINLCSVTIEYSHQTPSITWGALAYFDSRDSSPSSQLRGCNPRYDGVDAQPTTDEICISRDNSACNIGRHNNRHVKKAYFPTDTSSSHAPRLRSEFSSPYFSR